MWPASRRLQGVRWPEIVGGGHSSVRAASVVSMFRLPCGRRALAVALVGTLLLCYGDTSEAHHSFSGSFGQEHAADSLSSCEANDGAAHDPLGGGFLSALSLLIIILAVAVLSALLIVWRVAPTPEHSRPPPRPPVVCWLDRSRRAARLQVFLI